MELAIRFTILFLDYLGQTFLREPVRQGGSWKSAPLAYIHSVLYPQMDYISDN